MTDAQDHRTRDILALTQEIEDARRALEDSQAPAARARLQGAEIAYRNYLVSLNGLEPAQS